jgi:hypothetical protein
MAEDINCLLGKCKNVEQENKMMEEAKKMGRSEENSGEEKSSKSGYDVNDKKGVNIISFFYLIFTYLLYVCNLTDFIIL